MPQPSTHLFGQPSKPWDTSFARKFLKIPEHQLKMINSIPDWPAANEISVEKEIPPKFLVDKGIKTMGSALSSQNMNSVEKECLKILNPSKENTEKSNSSKENITKCNSSKKNVKNTKMTERNSLQLKKALHSAGVGKQSLPRSISLSVLNQLDDSKDNFKLRSSNSAPSIYEARVSNLNLTTFECDKKSQNSVKTSKSSKLNITQNTQLNETYLIQTLPENQEKTFANKVSHKTIKSDLKLGDRILNHKFLKESMDNVANKSLTEELYQNAASRNGKYHNPVLDKRLKLLEKRFSPSKEFCIVSEENISSIKIPKLSESVFNSTKNDGHFQVKDYVHTKSQNTDSNCLKASLNSKKTQNATIDVQMSLKIPGINEGKDISYESSDTRTHDVSLSSESREKILIEENFVSLPIPCGQPLPPDTISISSQNNLLKDSIKILNPSQNAQINVPEKLFPLPNDIAFLENQEGKTKTQDLPSNNAPTLSKKRKRKNKSDTPKKQNSKNLRMIDINFTSDQVKNMLDIIKLFNLED